MSRYQPLRGNPESKLSVLMNDFSGGINLSDEDDFVGTNQLRWAQNIDIDVEGNIKNRKGWTKNTALNELYDSYSKLPKYIEDRSSFVYIKEYMTHYSLSVPTNQRQTYEISTSGLTESDTLWFYGVVLSHGMRDYDMTIRINDSYFQIPSLGDLPFYDIRLAQIPLTGLLNGRNTITVRLPSQGWGMNDMLEMQEILIAPYKMTVEDSEGTFFEGRRAVEGMAVVEGTFLYNDKYNQFPQLLSSPSMSYFINTYSNPGIQQMMTPEYHRWYTANAPLVLVTVFADYMGILKAHTAHIYNSTSGYNIEETILTITGTDIVTTNNYVEGEGNFLTNISVAEWRDELVFVVKGAHKVASIRDVSYDSVKNLDPWSAPIQQFSKFEAKVFGKDMTSADNKAYKPSPWEVRNVGFNVLGTNPLTWLAPGVSGVSGIRGVFLTYGDDIPISFIPSNSQFSVNVMISGSLTLAFKFYTYVNNVKTEVPVSVGAAITTGTLRVHKFTLQSIPAGEIEIEITAGSIVFRDYFNAGDITSDLLPVTSIDIGDYNAVNVYDRVVYYGGNTIWWSDIKDPSYVPNYNYARLPFAAGQDEITGIVFFRSSYIIFTRQKIYKLTGGFDMNTMRIDKVSDTVGCIAPKTIKMVENQLLFLSSQGLQSLKSEQFRADQENIKALDDKVKPLFDYSPYPFATAFVKDDQYFLVLNSFYGDSDYIKNEAFDLDGREVPVPDSVRYYYTHNAFVFDMLPEDMHHLFVFNIGNQLFTFREDGVYNYDDSVTDFEEPYEVRFETAGLSLGYPAHEKKLKKLWVKMRKENFEQTVRINVYMDGFHQLTVDEYPEGDVRNPDIPGSISDQRLVRLPSIKGRNVTLQVVVKEHKPISFNSLSLEWKLGKMRG